MGQTYYNPKLGKWTYGEVTQEDLWKLWKLPGPSTSEDVQNWADTNQHGYYRADIMIHPEIKDIRFDIRLHCVLQTIYGRTFIEYSETDVEVVQLNGKPLHSVKDHEKIIHNEYSYPYIIPDEEYDELILQTLKEEFGILYII